MCNTTGSDILCICQTILIFYSCKLWNITHIIKTFVYTMKAFGGWGLHMVAGLFLTLQWHDMMCSLVIWFPCNAIALLEWASLLGTSLFSQRRDPPPTDGCSLALSIEPFHQELPAISLLREEATCLGMFAVNGALAPIKWFKNVANFLFTMIGLHGSYISNCVPRLWMRQLSLPSRSKKSQDHCVHQSASGPEAFP